MSIGTQLVICATCGAVVVMLWRIHREIRMIAICLMCVAGGRFSLVDRINDPGLRQKVREQFHAMGKARFGFGEPDG
jgi:hypothetical protein